MKRFYFILSILLYLNTVCSAQTNFTVTAPDRVSVGEQFAVTYTVTNGDGSKPQISQIDGCKFLYGPSVSTRMSYGYNSRNGKQSSSSVVEYSYIFKAEKEGEYKIKPTSIIINGKTYTSAEKSLTIIHAKQSQNSSNQSNSQASIYDPNSLTIDKNVSKDDVIVRIILNKNSAYEGEAIDCIIKLYTKYAISEFNPEQLPNFDGFYVKEDNIKSILNKIESLNGQDYYTAILKHCILFPQKSGNLTINSGIYNITVEQYEEVDMGFYPIYIPTGHKLIKINSNSETINIKPLPSPRPLNFTGAVGNFNVQSDIIDKTFRTNEPAILKYTVIGTGNLGSFRIPEIVFPEDFELYSPTLSEDIKINGNTLSGSITNEYTFVPENVGRFQLTIPEFSYFDPSKKEYIIIDSKSIDIDIAKGVSRRVETNQRRDIQANNEDILHIKNIGNNIDNSKGFVITKWWYWLIYMILSGFLIAAIVIYRTKIKKLSDIKGSKLAKANKVVKKRLSEARKYADKNEDENFYDATLKALWGYLGDKLMIPASSLTRDNISLEILNHGGNEKLSSDIIKVIDECEMARYSPIESRPSLNQIYQDASEVIKQMENLNIRRNNA